MKKYIIISASIIVVIVAVALIFYFKGKKTGNNIATLPGQTQWGKDLTDQESTEIKQHAQNLYKDMKGLNFMPRDASVYTSYLASSDRVFVGAANYFAENYGAGENLADWIDSESYTATNIGLQTTIDSIITKLAKFGIIAK